MRYVVALLLCVIPATSAISADKMAEYKQAIAATFRDPASVQFKDVRLAKNVDGDDALFGQVNAKNGYGGYAGFTHFCGAIIRAPRGLIANVALASRVGVYFVFKECRQP